jgi:hypothetical protein
MVNLRTLLHLANKTNQLTITEKTNLHYHDSHSLFTGFVSKKSFIYFNVNMGIDNFVIKTDKKVCNLSIFLEFTIHNLNLSK